MVSFAKFLLPYLHDQGNYKKTSAALQTIVQYNNVLLNLGYAVFSFLSSQGGKKEKVDLVIFLIIFCFFVIIVGLSIFFGNLGHSDNNHKYKTKIRNFKFIQPLSHSCWLEQSQGLYEGRPVASIDPKAELSEGH